MTYRLVISVWGDPQKWKKVPYKINDHTYGDRNNSTQVIGDHFGANLLVIIPVSLTDACGMGLGPDRQAEKSVEYIKQFYPNDKLEIIAAPSVGTFRIGSNIVNFNGNLDLFKVYSFYKLLGTFEGIKEDLELYADLTYGINYMSMANYEAIKLAVSLYCTLYDKKAKITAMNSDPFTASIGADPIRINTIEKLSFDREIGINYITGELRSKFDKNRFEWSRITGKRDTPWVDTNEIKSLFIAMNSFGAFLPCLVRNDQMRSYMNGVESIMKDFESSVLKDLYYSQNVYGYKFSLDESIILIFSALKVLTMDLFTNTGVLAPLNKLRDLSKTTLSLNIARYLLNEEIKKIQEWGALADEGKLVLFRTLKGEGNLKKPCGSNSRILIAHCALEMNTTHLMKQRGEILLGYGECLEELIKILKRI